VADQRRAAAELEVGERATVRRSERGHQNAV
jgi:hypothetical protein